MQGKIIKIISNLYTVAAEEEQYACHVRGKFRKLKITPLVGDNVIFDPTKAIIEEILPRKNELIRPNVANVDQAIIVVSVKEPDLDLYLLDKLLCLILYHHIKPILCFTKLDLLEDETTILPILNYYRTIGFDVYRNDDLKPFSQVFKDKVTVLTGQSGAGKSTLFNRLDTTLHLKTGEISKALGRGKHTTRHVELIPTLSGMCIDTPGFSSLSLKEIKKQEIKDYMKEFTFYQNQCEYRDCMHEKEEECAIKKRVGKEILLSRYENYLKFLKEGEL